MDEDEYFWTQVNKTETCWLWTGNKQHGYGIYSLRSNGRNERPKAHRFAWEFFNGEIEPGMTLDHICRVRHCVNPDHLEEVTRAENTRRAHHCRTCTCGG